MAQPEKKPLAPYNNIDGTRDWHFKATGTLRQGQVIAPQESDSIFTTRERTEPFFGTHIREAIRILRGD